MNLRRMTTWRATQRITQRTNELRCTQLHWQVSANSNNNEEDIQLDADVLKELEEHGATIKYVLSDSWGLSD